MDQLTWNPGTWKVKQSLGARLRRQCVFFRRHEGVLSSRLCGRGGRDGSPGANGREWRVTRSPRDRWASGRSGFALMDSVLCHWKQQTSNWWMTGVCSTFMSDSRLYRSVLIKIKALKEVVDWVLCFCDARCGRLVFNGFCNPLLGLSRQQNRMSSAWCARNTHRLETPHSSPLKSFHRAAEG